jgi:hypothetical protein
MHKHRTTSVREKRRRVVGSGQIELTIGAHEDFVKIS